MSVYVEIEYLIDAIDIAEDICIYNEIDMQMCFVISPICCQGNSSP